MRRWAPPMTNDRGETWTLVSQGVINVARDGDVTLPIASGRWRVTIERSNVAPIVVASSKILPRPWQSHPWSTKQSALLSGRDIVAADGQTVLATTTPEVAELIVRLVNTEPEIVAALEAAASIADAAEHNGGPRYSGGPPCPGWERDEYGDAPGGCTCGLDDRRALIRALLAKVRL